MSQGGAGFSPSAGDRAISDEENAHVRLLLVLAACFFEQARIEFQCSKMLAWSRIWKKRVR